MCVFHVPFLYLATISVSPFLLIPALLLPVALILAGRLIEQKRRWPISIWRAVYYPAVTAALILPVLFWYLADATFLVTGLVFAFSLGFFTPGTKAIKIVLALLLAVIISRSILLGLEFNGLIGLIALTVAVLGLLGAFTKTSRLSRAYAVIGFLALLHAAAFFSGKPFWRKAEILGHDFVRPVLTVFDQNKNISEGLSGQTQVRFLTEDAGGKYYLAGTRYKFPYLFRINKSDPTKIERISLPGGTSDNLVRVQTDNSVIVGDFEGHRILRVQVDPFRIISELPFSDKRVGLFQAADDFSRLYLVNDLDDSIYSLDPQNLTILAQVAGKGWNAAMLCDSTGEDIYRTGIDGTLTRYRAPSFIQEASAKLRGAYFFNLELDEKGGRLFASSTSRGFLYELDPLTLAIRQEAPIDRGVRFAAYDTVRNILYVGNYFTGELMVIDPKTLQQLGSVYLGPRLRWLEITADKQRLLIASGFGGFEVDLSGLVGYIAGSPD